MIRFSANLNKVALVRNSRAERAVPGLLEMAAVCLENGADGITLHPRPDRRHSLAEDAHRIRQWLEPGRAELNLEGNPFALVEDDYPGFMAMVREVRPDQCTLVPDTRDQLTSDRGWQLGEELPALAGAISDLKALPCRVSLFIEPQPRLVARAAELGADCVEIFTGPWARAWKRLMHSADGETQARVAALHAQYTETAAAAVDANLEVHAGHDLNLDNLAPIVRLPGLREVSIGHALIADALHLGMGPAVRRYLDVVRQAHGSSELPLDLPG